MGAEPTPPAQPLLEVGWVLSGRFDPPDREAVDAARRRVLETLTASFPAFAWRLPQASRESAASGGREEVVHLLDQAVVEREAKGWDFVLAITNADLVSFYKPFAVGAPSRGLAVACASTNRIDPEASGRGEHEGDRSEIIARRLHALALHLLAHLVGLDHCDDPASFLHDVGAVSDLDTMQRFGTDETEEMERALTAVADLRLEEREAGRRAGRVAFYLRTVWHERRRLLRAILAAQPWQFPFRLSRLTTAAVSTLVVLVITAEAWDLGMSQGSGFVAAFSLAVLILTSSYILRRQRLLVHREVSRLTEQSTLSNVTMVVVVVLGMATTYVALFGLVLLLGRLFFRPDLVASWAASVRGEIGLAHHLVFAAFVASLGLAIGALGASFEEQTYFRHVAYVDEET